MLAGQYQHQVDYKGRVSVPKKFRSELASGGVLTRGLDGCLFLYSHSSWDALSAKLRKLPLTGKDARAFSRFMFSNAVEVDFDRLGRINIPPFLLQFAKIGSDVTVVGVGDRIEIWSASSWKIFQEVTETESSEVAEKLTESGI